MKVFYLSSECAPFALSGGLGDVIGALPKAVKSVEGNIDVSVILPFYDTIPEKYSNEFIKTCDITFNLSWRCTGATVYEFNENGIKYYFIENHRYFNRGRLYGEVDDGERFAFFSMAALEFMLKCGEIPDILHANDWQTALSVIYLKTIYKKNSLLHKIRTLYTVHNIEYQGRFGIDALTDIFGLEREYLPFLEYNGDLNLMKGALTLSDYISTVSPNYRDELNHDFFAFGLAPVISSISHKMCGIINGIDYSYFSPNEDNDIYFSYNKDNVRYGKIKNKLEFQKEMGLEVSEKIPLIVMIGRLTATKGIDLFLHIIEELLSYNVQVAILGTGEARYEREFIKLSYKYENLISVIKFDRALSKKMYAAADMFLMPSRSEPCGLAQMIACSYGCVPIVRSVGGLYDTIKHWNGKEGNGFRFDNYNAHELLFALKDAIELYSKQEIWKKLQSNAINSKFEWSDSAKKYIAIYNNLLNW